MLPCALLLLLLVTACSAQPPPGVCAFASRDGAATATGVSTIRLPTGSGSVVNVPTAIAATGSVARPMVFVLGAPKTGPEDALFGWAIMQNATAQTLYAWTNDPATQPTCITASVALPDYFVPGFSLCGGNVQGALWPAFQGTYSIGHATVNEFSQPKTAGEAFEGGSCLAARAHPAAGWRRRGL